MDFQPLYRADHAGATQALAQPQGAFCRGFWCVVINWLAVELGWLAGDCFRRDLYHRYSCWAAYYFLAREALEALLLERKIGIELLMAIAAIAATALGQAAEGAMLVFLYSLSEAAEGYTEEKTRSAVKALMDLAPKILPGYDRNGSEQEIPVEEVVIGDVFILKPGQSIPTDGEIIMGESSINQAPVTGESVPVEKQQGDSVFAGSINGQGSLEVDGY